MCVRARERVHSFLKECFMSKKEDEGVGVGGGAREGKGREKERDKNVLLCQQFVLLIKISPKGCWQIFSSPLPSDVRVCQSDFPQLSSSKYFYAFLWLRSGELLLHFCIIRAISMRERG